MPRAVISLLILGLWQGVALASERHWSKGITGEPIHPEDRLRFSISFFRADEDVLTGVGMFENYIKGNPNPPPAMIKGHKLPDGSFWPSVTLQVGKDLNGPWRTIRHSSSRGKQATLTVEAGKPTFALNVDLSPFNPMLRKIHWGRVVLSTGDAAYIELKDLLD
jgi:hypothetical protein